MNILLHTTTINKNNNIILSEIDINNNVTQIINNNKLKLNFINKKFITLLTISIIINLLVELLLCLIC